MITTVAAVFTESNTTEVALTDTLYAKSDVPATGLPFTSVSAIYNVVVSLSSRPTFITLLTSDVSFSFSGTIFCETLSESVV